MNKLKNYLLLGLLALTTFSCDKENKFQPREEEPIPTKAYSTSTPVSAYEFDGEAKESLRAMIISKGYSVPKLNVTKEEFKANTIPAHFGVMGNNQENVFKSTLNILDSKPSKISEDAFMIRQGASVTDPTLINMYCQLPQTLTTDKSYSWLALDGKLVNDKLVYNSANNTSPNAIVKGIKNTNIDDARHLPIITDIVPFNTLFAPLTKKSIRFNPRGVLVGISLINQLDESITLKSITFPEDNALFFEGSFDCQKDMEGKTYKSALVSNANEAKAMLFEGENKSVIVPVKQDANATFVSQAGKTVDANLKESLPLFYVWGFPNNGVATLKVKLTFAKNGTDVESKVLNIAIPSAGFVEGKAYRLPIKLDKDSLGELPSLDPATAQCQDIRPISLNFRTPLDFVAEMPAINKAGTGFVKNHCLPHIPNTDLIYDYEAGYYSWYEAKALFTEKDWLKNYYLPNKEQMLSIIPYNRTDQSVMFNQEKSESTLIERAQVGETPAQDYTSDFITVKEGSIFVTYAIRFKGTQWESAWRYSYNGADEDKKMIIKCVPLTGINTGKTLAQIKNPDFFANNAHSLRVYPSYGYSRNKEDYMIYVMGTASSQWTSSPNGSDWAERMGYSYYGATVGINYNRLTSYTIRPFRKQL